MGQQHERRRRSSGFGSLVGVVGPPETRARTNSEWKNDSNVRSSWNQSALSLRRGEQGRNAHTQGAASPGDHGCKSDSQPESVNYEFMEGTPLPRSARQGTSVN